MDRETDRWIKQMKKNVKSRIYVVSILFSNSFNFSAIKNFFQIKYLGKKNQYLNLKSGSGTYN